MIQVQRTKLLHAVPKGSIQIETIQCSYILCHRFIFFGSIVTLLVWYICIFRLKGKKSDPTYKADSDSDLDSDSETWMTVSVRITEWKDWFTDRYIADI